MSNDTHMRTVGLRSSELITLDSPPDAEVIAKVEDVVESGGHYIDTDASCWVGGEDPDSYLVVFRHDTQKGIARRDLISDLSDRGIRAKIDPL